MAVRTSLVTFRWDFLLLWLRSWPTGSHAPQLDDHQHVEDQDATQRPHEPEHQALEGEGSLVVENALPLLLCRGAGRIVQ